jgi:hypothetical protein
MFEKLVWYPDRLQHYANDHWELRDQCFLYYKIKFLVDQYAEFWSLRQDFHARNILKLGMWDGGSIAFWFCTLLKTGLGVIGRSFKNPAILGPVRCH